MISKTYKINSDYDVVKSSYSDIRGELVKKLLPFGCGLDKYKGLRRRAVLRVWVGSKMYKFKVAMYSSTKQKYYLHIVNAEDGPFNLKFFSTRISVVDKTINIHYAIKGMKYKLLFINK